MNTNPWNLKRMMEIIINFYYMFFYFIYILISIYQFCATFGVENMNEIFLDLMYVNAYII